MWEKDREQYFKTYIQGQETPTTPAMRIGTMIHNVNEHFDYPWIKEARGLGFRGKKMMNLRKAITKVMRAATPGSEPEIVMTAPLTDFFLFIKMDRFHRKNRELDELKTTDHPHWWPVQIHSSFQLDFYALALFKRTHSFFREIRFRELDWGKGNMKTTSTTRSYRDIELTEARVLRIVQEMKDAGIWNLRLSRADRDKLKQGKLL